MRIIRVRFRPLSRSNFVIAGLSVYLLGWGAWNLYERRYWVALADLVVGTVLIFMYRGLQERHRRANIAWRRALLLAEREAKGYFPGGPLD